jgi:hypothetical protein
MLLVHSGALHNGYEEAEEFEVLDVPADCRDGDDGPAGAGAKVAASKWGSKLLLIAVPFLIASGIITITFSGGMPTVNVNRDRATAVGRDLSTEAYKAAERVRDYGESGYR